MALTPGQLKALAQLTGTGFDLPVSALGSAALTAYLAPLLPGGSLVLTGATRAETDGGVRVTGTGSGGVLDGLAVTAELTAGPADTAVLLTATAPGPWSPLSAFPVLAGTIWADCAFTDVALTFDSATPPDDAGQIPYAFTGTLVITTRLAALDLLFSGTSHTLTGILGIVTPPPEVTVPMTTVPRILLSSGTSPELDLGLVTLTERRYSLLALPDYNSVLADLDVVARLLVTTSVPFRIAGQAQQIAFCAELSGWDADLLLRGIFDGVPAMDLADVSGFAGQGDDGLTIPMDVTITAPVTVTDITLAVTPQLTIGYAVLELRTQEEWTIAQGVELQAIDVLFRVDDPLGGPKLRGTLSGLIAFGEYGTLVAEVDFATKALAAYLRDGDDPLMIREVYTDLTGQDAGHLPDVEVDRFELWGALADGDQPFSFSAQLDLSGEWPITGSLSLYEAGVQIDYGATVTFRARGTLLVGGVEVFLYADYATGTGWTFSGQTGGPQAIAIGPFLAELSSEYGDFTLPEPLAALTIERLAAEISTAQGRLVATAEAAFPIDDVDLDLTLTIDTAARSLDGLLTVRIPTVREPGWSDILLDFDLHLAGDQGATSYAASYTAGDGDAVPGIDELAGAISSGLAALVPGALVVGIGEVVLGSAAGARVLMVGLTATIDLAGLPVAGALLHGDQVMGMDPLRVIVTTAAMPEDAVATLNGLLPAAVAPLPDQDLPEGFTFDGRLRLGALEAPMSLPVAPARPPASGPAPALAQSGDNVVWRKIELSIGPLHVERVGISYLHQSGRPATLAVLVDAALSVGGLTLALTGLSAALALDDPLALPSFDLAGLGVDYAEGPVQISGAFLKDTLTYEGKSYPSYNGKAVIETEAFSVGALGSYAQLPDGPSLFVYAFLDHPIGGPAFFYVTGLAAGFGYDRRLVAPDVSAVADFPLVAEALGTLPPSDLPGELHRLADVIPPSPGDYFLAIGVRFTSFKMIDSFLLLTVGFGQRCEFDVLGLSTLVLPAPDEARGDVTPVAQLQLALKASFAPGDGYFSLLAQLTPGSYLLSRDCRLTGGFAFVTWFGEEHSGDFVLTVGGYHPHFAVPAHYPSVPRLGFNWQVSEQLTLKGSAYYALTPVALMAGGSLSATWQDGSLTAWFDAGLDLLIAWQPYHYEVSLHISVGARYSFTFFGRHTISVHVGTDVSFWGPEFGGQATLDLDIVSITIRFGDQHSAAPQPLPWDRFRDVQLPPAAGMTTIVLRGGGVLPGSDDDLGVVNPLELALVTDSAIPATAGLARTAALPGGTPFGIAPCGIAGGFASTHTITITRDGAPAEASFVFTPVTKDLPAALWGGELTPSLAKPSLVAGLLTGYVITAAPPVEAAHPASLPAGALTQATPVSVEQDAFDWAALPAFTATGQPLDTGQGAPARAAIAGKLLPGVPVDLRGLSAADFLEAPQVAHV
ncbi:DUF6603 domain-containing protein [Nonomuraea sp. NPDC050783]|uniref:DUF6603 domain-containing protein n=1 Tax=Nonomuraea sp. NPDC050783 TaxID=3154634 RepID=UPI003466C146